MHDEDDHKPHMTRWDTFCLGFIAGMFVFSIIVHYAQVKKEFNFYEEVTRGGTPSDHP